MISLKFALPGILAATAVTGALIKDGTITVADIGDPELVAIGSVTSATDKVPYFTAPSSAATATLTSFGRTLISSSDASAAVSSLGLSTAALFAADSWTNTWTYADGNPTSVGWSSWNVTASAPTVTASSKTAHDGSSISCYLVTPGSGDGESGIRITWGSGAARDWELRVRAWIPAGSTSTWAFGYNTADNGTDEWFYINPKAAGATLNSASITTADLTGSWVDWTLRVYETINGAGFWEVWAGPLLLKIGILSDGAALRSAGRFEFGKFAGANVTGGCLAYVKLKDNGINEAPPSYTFKGQGVGP